MFLVSGKRGEGTMVMEQEKRKINVTLMGNRFTVRSEKEEPYIHSLAQFITSQLESVRRHTRAVSTHHLALLVALNLADEVFTLNKQNAELKVNMRERTQKLKDEIETLLQQLPKSASSGKKSA